MVLFYSLSASFCPEPSEIATGLQTQSFTSEVSTGQDSTAGK